MFKTKPSMIATAVLLSLGLSACGGSSDDNKEQEIVNTAPTAIALSAMSVDEHAIGAVVGTLSTVDADENEEFSYEVSDERFEIVADELKLKAGVEVNYETESEIALSVTVTDSAEHTYTQELTIEITDIDGIKAVIDGVNIPETYAFKSKLVDDSSSVSHSGQTARQLLINELKSYVGKGLAADVDAGTITSGDEAKAKLMRMYAATEEQWDEDADYTLSTTTTPAALKNTLREVSGSHKNLQEKIAGNDRKTDHKDWSTQLVGWNEKGSITPDSLVIALFDQLAANVDTHLAGTIRQDITGAAITKLYLQTDGTDINQLLNKFLLGAVTFSQGADDYLDYDVDGKGLKSDNIKKYKGSKPYTSLEHQFDEGFGYFGAAHNYADYTDLEIRKKDGREAWQGYNDVNADDAINFHGEYNFGTSVNAAKRDVGTASNTNPTDFTAEAFAAFVQGRAIINNAAGRELTEDEMTKLLAQRDIAVLTWEKAIVATMIHYINDTNADLAQMGTDEFDYANLAKHWSELKGFSLNLQFSPHSPMTDAQFAAMQQLIGMQPALLEADVADYTADLLTVRTMLKDVYNFDEENVANW